MSNENTFWEDDAVDIPTNKDSSFWEDDAIDTVSPGMEGINIVSKDETKQVSLETPEVKSESFYEQYIEKPFKEMVEPSKPKEEGTPYLNKKKFTQKDLEGLATKYGKSKKWVEDAILWEGGDIEFNDVDKDTSLIGGLAEGLTSPESWGRVAKGVAGEVQRQSILAGLPNKLRKSLAPPEDQKALNEIQDEVNKRESMLDIAMAITTADPLLRGGVSVGAKIAGKLGEKTAPKVEKVINLMTPGVLGGLTGLGVSKEGEEFQGIMTGVLGGVALQGAFRYFQPKITKKRERSIIDATQKIKDSTPTFNDAVATTLRGDILDPEQLTKVAGELKLKRNNVAYYRNKMLERGVDMTMEEATQNLARRKVQEEVISFARGYLKPSYPDMKLTSKSSILENIPKQMSKDVKEAAVIQRLYEDYKTIKIAKNEIKKGVINEFDSNRETYPTDSFFEYIGSSQHVAAAIDRMHGTTVEPAIHKLSDNLMKYQDVVASFVSKHFKPLRDAMAKSQVDINQAYRYIESGTKMEDIPTNFKPVVTAINDYNKSIVEEAKNLGLPIDTIENYFRRQTKSPTEIVATLENRVDELLADNINLKKPGLRGARWNKLVEKSPKAKEMMVFLEDFSKKKIQSSSDFEKTMEYIISRDGALDMESYVASSLRKRVGEIPDFVREKNPLKVARNSLSVFKTALMRDSIADLRREKKLLEAVGDSNHAEYIQEVIDSTLGRRTPSSFGKLAKIGESWEARKILQNTKISKEQAKLESMKEGLPVNSKTVADIQTKIDQLEIEKETWEITNQMGSLMYQNFLGWDYSKPLRNLSQPFLLTATEIGGFHGQKTVVEAYVRAMKNGTEIAKELRDNGQLAVKYSKDQIDDIVNELTALSKGKRLTKAAIKRFSEIGLYLYTKSDMINRVVTVNAADIIAEQYAKGLPAAKKVVGNLSDGYKTLIRHNKIEVKDALRNYLLARTQYQYTRPALSKFARDLNPMFRVFSKWPSETTGDLYGKLSLIQDKDAALSKAFTKYLGPYAMAAMYDKYVSSSKERSPSAKVLLGKGKLQQKVPGENIKMVFKDLMEGKVAGTPHIEFLKGLWSGDYLGTGRKTLDTYGPLGPIDMGLRTYQFLSGEEMPKASELIIPK